MTSVQKIQAKAWDEGACAERARIVTYLREMGSDDEANAIERGAHLEAQKQNEPPTPKG